MFGTYRILLAVFVVLTHLGELPAFGRHAVFGFYILSGYLMTLVMQVNYGYSKRGVIKYSLNRFLRIYPLYWMALLISTSLAFILDQTFTKNYHESLFLPTNLFSLLQNIFLILKHTSEPRLVPPAWALTVELFFYTAIGLGLSRSRRGTLLWFILSLTYTFLVNILRLSSDFRYFSIAAASLPFSTGALIYHFKKEALVILAPLKRPYIPMILFILILMNAIMAIKWRFYTVPFYINYFLNSAIILSLIDRDSLPFIPNKIDTFLGDFSYPIYLTHYQSGLILLSTGWVLFPRGNLSFFFISIPLVFLTAWLLTLAVERPIERIRTRIKRGLKAEDAP